MSTSMDESITSDPEWTRSDSHADLVSLSNTIKLEVRILGPQRHRDPNGSLAPLVIIEHGLGGCLYEWPPTARFISAFARVLHYNRAGYGRSTPAPSSIPRTISHMNAELHELLSLVGQAPPYILVGQSYGGNIIRSFLHQYPAEVAGMVLVDSYCVYEPALDNSMFGALLGPPGEQPVEDYADVMGLRDFFAFSADEAKELKDMSQTEAFGAAVGAEEKEFLSSIAALNEAQGLLKHEDGNWSFRHRQLGDGRLSVLAGSTAADFTKLMDNAKAKGFGTEEQRRDFEVWLGNWTKNEMASKAAALSLSSESRVVVAVGKAATHDMHYTSPEVIAKEVRWVLGLDG